VFVNLARPPIGAPMRPGAINELLAALSRRAGLKQTVHPHQLRHGFASDVLDSGGSLDEVQSCSGTPACVQRNRISTKPRRPALLGTGSLLLTQVSVGGGYFGDVPRHPVFGLASACLRHRHDRRSPRRRRSRVRDRLRPQQHRLPARGRASVGPSSRRLPSPAPRTSSR
jgi:hypothetical protein